MRKKRVTVPINLLGKLWATVLELATANGLRHAAIHTNVVSITMLGLLWASAFIYATSNGETIHTDTLSITRFGILWVSAFIFATSKELRQEAIHIDFIRWHLERENTQKFSQK